LISKTLIREFLENGNLDEVAIHRITEWIETHAKFEVNDERARCAKVVQEVAEAVKPEHRSVAGPYLAECAVKIAEVRKDDKV
jgi:hypothetical protein